MEGFGRVKERKQTMHRAWSCTLGRRLRVYEYKSEIDGIGASEIKEYREDDRPTLRVRERDALWIDRFRERATLANSVIYLSEGFVISTGYWKLPTTTIPSGGKPLFRTRWFHFGSIGMESINRLDRHWFNVGNKRGNIFDWRFRREE